MSSIGHNLPPPDIETAREAMTALATYLENTPAILSPSEAKEANEYCCRVERTLKDLDAARHDRVDPLTHQVNSINAAYRGIRVPLERALDVLKTRLTAYVAREEEKRRAEAERLRREAEEKERIAREAEAAEQEAIANAAVGETTDVGGAIESADAAFEDFNRAQRAAVIAERDSTVRLRSVLGGRARSLRTTEVLHVADAAAAFTALWPAYDAIIAEALLTAARAYRKQHGRLPEGIVREEVRSL